jgi:hypothetical protein
VITLLTEKILVGLMMTKLPRVLEEVLVLSNTCHTGKVILFLEPHSILGICGQNGKDLNTSNSTSGTTYNLVIQPLVNTGYLYNLSNKWNTGISLGFGREINIITRGENVGEGWMGIATFS